MSSQLLLVVSVYCYLFAFSNAANSAERPFPIVEAQVGDILLAIPKEWVDGGHLSLPKSDQPFVHFPDLRSIKLRAVQLEIPAAKSLRFSIPAPGLATENLRRKRLQIDARWSERKPDADGFWEWKRHEYLAVEQKHPRPLDQPLIVNCVQSERPESQETEQRCGVTFYWSPGTTIRYDFYDTEIPKPLWADVDRRVLEFIRLLDGRQPFIGRN